jgi:hypothetical protein
VPFVELPRPFVQRLCALLVSNAALGGMEPVQLPEGDVQDHVVSGRSARVAQPGPLEADAEENESLCRHLLHACNRIRLGVESRARIVGLTGPLP